MIRERAPEEIMDSVGMLRGIDAMAHKGKSGKNYAEEESVVAGDVIDKANGGKSLVMDYVKSVTHTHRRLGDGANRCERDGVKVEVLYVTSEEADDIDDMFFEL